MNGYSNYETWVVHLWITNHEEYYKMFRQYIDDIADKYNEFTKLTIMEKKVEEFVRIMSPKASNFWSDLIVNTRYKINYYEIAKALLEE